MKRYLSLLVILASPFLAIADDEIKKESSIKIRGTTKIETDTYVQSGDRVLEIKRIISLRDDKAMTQQKIMWKDCMVLEFDISHMDPGSGQFLRFHSVPGVNAVTSAKADGTIQSISLVTTNLTVLRAFNVVDGLLSPVPMAEVRRANAIQGEVKNLFQDFQSGDTNGDVFMDRAKELMKKYNTDNGTTTKSTLSSEGAPSDER